MTFRFWGEDENVHEIWVPVFKENTEKIYNADDFYSLLAV